MKKKKILIISITNQDSDPRVVRQINFLKDQYDVYCCGVSNNLIPEENFYPLKVNSNTLIKKITIGTLKLLKFYSIAESFALKSKLNIEKLGEPILFDLIIANDIDTISLAFKIFKAKIVISDFHEYAPSEFEDKLYWRYIHTRYVNYQCKKYFPSLSAITTVCKSIAEEYKKQFNKLPIVITNAADYYDLKPTPVKEGIKIIHHGAAISSRKIELMIEVAKMLDERFTFDLMLIPNENAYYNNLKRMVKDYDNINIINPVNFNEIITFCNSYDIGLFILPPVNFNYKYALPNKFFEFIQSRLSIITGPSFEMDNYIRKYGLGISTKTFDPSEIAYEINQLSNEQIEEFKFNSHKNAQELSSSKNKVILNNLVTNLISN